MASPLLFLLLTSLPFLSTTVPTAEATNGTLNQGDSLTGAATLVSAPDGVFELGFFSPGGGDGDRRYLGIWYRNVTPQTVVWVANRDAPAAGAGASLTLTAAGELRVLDGGAGAVLWSSNASAGGGQLPPGPGNFTAALGDSGNLELRLAGGDDAEPVWQSFDHPGDTMLSGMRIRVRAGGERMLFTSWKDAGDPARGRFALGLDPAGSGQAYIWRDGSTPVWRSGQWTGQDFAGIPYRPLYLYGYKQANDPTFGVYYTYTATNASLQRFVVSPNGTDVCYMLTDSKWETVWLQPSNDCERYATCGPNANCVAGDDGKAACHCLRGFQPNSTEEWGAGNWSQGCRRSSPLGCQQNQTGDGFVTVAGIKLPDFSNWVSTVADEAGCREDCLANCSCGAYAYMSAIGCMHWGLTLLDIVQIPDGRYNIFLKLPASELPAASTQMVAWKVAIVATAVVLFILVVCFLLWWKRGRKIKDAVHGSWKLGERSQRSSGEMLDLSQSSPFDNESEDSKGHDLRLYSLDYIKAATGNFSDSNKLGAGGFGPVYKGTLPGGGEVAVKRLSRSSGQGLEEFKNEVILIAKLQHRNLVRLLGCCVQGEEKILVYEYMPNKSLDVFLFNPDKKGLLDWRTRFNIIEGIARGLLYLHRDSRLRIVHRDLKASNILLDTDMNPKISDFGMARIFGGDQNQFNTNRVVGTLGYMSPEYAMEGIFSVKSDVYSFGVLMLEIITGQRAVSFHNKEDSLNIAGYAWRLWNEDKAGELIDPAIRPSCPARQVMRCIHIALLCVQDRAHDRPDVPMVILMLSNDSSILPSPKPPTLMMQLDSSESEKLREKDATYSVCDVSVTQLHGR